MAETVAAIHRVLASGSSFPSVVETSAGHLYVLKLSGAGPGRRALATEYLALKIARQLGLTVPDALVIDLPRDFPWQTGTDEFYEAVQRSAGANLGVAFIADAHDLTAHDLADLPVPFIQRLAAVDALLQNVDRTAANPNIMRDTAGVHWAIDFGACLLIERLARGALAPRMELPPNHFLVARDVADAVRNAAGQIDAAFLEPVIAALPGHWVADFGLSRLALLQRLVTYLADVRMAGPA
jgi:hypothetical protein